MGKKECELCGEIFELKIHNQKFCKKEECRKFSHLTKIKRKEYLLKKNATINYGSNGSKQKIIEQNLNGFISNYKILTKYKNLAERVVLLMNKSKIETYPEALQSQCYEVIQTLENFLKKQYIIKPKTEQPIFKRGEIIDV